MNSRRLLGNINIQLIMDVEGFEIVTQGIHTIIVRGDWKSFLLQDLLDDFRRIPPSDRLVHAGGRQEHFSYLPAGAPARVFVRRASRGGLIGRLLGNLYLGTRRPLRELRAAAAARRAGVDVPEPLAVRSTKVGLFRRFAIVTREIPGASNLMSLAGRLTAAERRRVTLHLADEVQRLHEAGVYHADMTLKNALWNGSSVTIVDLDKATLLTGRCPALDMDNLARLNRSIVKFLGAGLVTRADKLRFLRRYLGGSERLTETARRCGSGLWFHRLWWSLSGQERRSP